jgi:hypothetical protein
MELSNVDDLRTSRLCTSSCRLEQDKLGVVFGDALAILHDSEGAAAPQLVRGAVGIKMHYEGRHRKPVRTVYKSEENEPKLRR